MWHGILLVAFAAWSGSAEAYMSATLHHELSTMEDTNENGIPDALEAYMEASVEFADDYDPASTDSDGDGVDDLTEWILGTDPLAAGDHFCASVSSSTNSGAVGISMSLPDYFGAYAEVFGKSDLVYGDWEVMAAWLPTYGASELTWDDLLATNKSSFFYMIFDATDDLDEDGYSDNMEYFITGTDPTEFDNYDTDGDGLHDWWEYKLFGDLSQSGSDDYDGDLLLNGEELVWGSDDTIVMYSDPSLFDTDGEGLDDGLEGAWTTDPLESDSDGDGASDAVEVLAALRTDPNNPDVTVPTISFN
jgi:hypothetical protein